MKTEELDNGDLLLKFEPKELNKLGWKKMI